MPINLRRPKLVQNQLSINQSSTIFTPGYLCSMHYVSVENLAKSYGIQPLFENISFHIEEGDKIALVARNGSGKSTLLKILAGQEFPDDGMVWINKDVDVALFEQEPVFEETKSILDNIFFHNHPVINAIKEFEAICETTDPLQLNEIGRAHV